MHSNKPHRTLSLLLAALIIVLPTPGHAGLFSKCLKRSISRRAIVKKAAKRAARRRAVKRAARKSAKKSINGKNIKKMLSRGKQKFSTKFGRRKTLLDRIIKDANRVAPRGAKINKYQRSVLGQNVPQAARRNKLATRAMRRDFATRERKKMINTWEAKRGRKWPAKRGRKATLHHIIPLESGGPNKWYNAVPTYGRGPTHSLKGRPGPHAKNSVLRKTIQQPRSRMKPKQVTPLLRR